MSCQSWDSLVIRAALNGACTVLHTEDMHVDYMIEDVLRIDPFATDSQAR